MIFNNWSPATRDKIRKAEVDKFISDFIKAYKSYKSKIRYISILYPYSTNGFKTLYICHHPWK